MIILKHLTVERFRLLREVNLHFPQRGSILIEGPNESGKSALLESVYFALYGVPLTTERGKRSLDDLIMYGATQATVTLTLLVSTTELTITRSIERGKGQKISLSVHKSGMPEEGPITRLATANERILTELGRMDGERYKEQFSPLLADPVNDVRKAAQTALRPPGQKSTRPNTATPVRNVDGSRSWTIGASDTGDDEHDWKARLRSLTGE